MKNIKYIAILVFQCALLQFTFGQSADDNGRQVDAKPGPIVKTETPIVKDVPNKGTYPVDLDVSGTRNEDVQENKEDTYYPTDLDIGVEKVDDLSTLVDDLLRITEELRQENKIIRESLNNCYSSNELGLSANDAYLIQNAPNPFNESAEIRYFVPDGLEDVEIHIRDIKGSVMSAIKIKEAGYGKLVVDSATFGNGTFVYTLSVKREIIDSKVMIVTN